MKEKNGKACTTFIAGRKVTTDGSRIFGRTDDSHGLAVKTMVSVPPLDRKGPWTYVDGDNQLRVELPGKSCGFICAPSAKPAPGAPS